MYQLIMDTKKALGHKKNLPAVIVCVPREVLAHWGAFLTFTFPKSVWHPLPSTSLAWVRGGCTTLLWDISLEYFVYSVDGFRRLRLVPLAVNQRRLIRPSRTQNLPSPAQNLASRAQNLQALPRQIWKLVSAALFTLRRWQISLCWRWCDLTYVCQRSWFFERRRISEPSAEAGRGVAWNDKRF